MHFGIIGTLATVFVLSVMVFVHELGHFIVAKLCGVKVEVFSLGFGKRLIGFQRGETDYRISLLPLGGYVKMSGELPTDAPTGAVDEFSQHPRWQRILIALAGPCANFLLAIALLTGVYMFHNEVNEFLTAPVVLDYVPVDSTAARAGFRTGDHVVSIDGISDPDWDKFGIQVALGANRPQNVIIDRNGQRQAINFTPASPLIFDEGFTPIIRSDAISVDAVEGGMPAAKAGVKPGDRITAIDSFPVHSDQSFVYYLQDRKGQPAILTVHRGSDVLQIPVQPVLNAAPTAEKADAKRYQIGVVFTPPPARIERQSLPDAFTHSIRQNIANSTLIFEVFRRIVTLRMSARSVDGPIGIWQETSRTVQMPGWSPLAYLMAIISLNLGIVNLLPIPILDGGVIVLLLIESIMRHDLQPQIKERIYQAAFVIIILLFALSIFNDVSKLSFFNHAKP
jgi:regulator of sigma E protease